MAALRTVKGVGDTASALFIPVLLFGSMVVVLHLAWTCAIFYLLAMKVLNQSVFPTKPDTKC